MLHLLVELALGAFAFTQNVWYIVLGNDLGAIVVAIATLKSIEKVGQYKWLKNGAMTSIGVWGPIILIGAFGIHLPEWLPPITTMSLVGVTFLSSHRHLKKQ